MTPRTGATCCRSRGIYCRTWLNLLFLSSLALSACTPPVAPYSKPAIPLPANYQQATDPPPGGTPPASSTPEQSSDLTGEALIEWWRHFGNNELERLIDRGIANNPDIHIALNRVVQAKARADQAGAGLNPTVSAPLVAALQYPGDVTVGTAPTGSSANKSSQAAFQASIRADWRLDVWGEQKALADSAAFQLRRAIFERENVQRNLAASMASNYVEFLSLNDRLRTALENEEVLNATLTAIEKRVKSGDATLAELEQQRTVVYSVRATIPALEQQRLDAIGSMAFLAGTVPGNIVLSDQGLDALSVPRAVPGLPADLLLRRPDVRMAEAQLQVANADVAVARARLLPPVDLSAQAGYSSISLSQLFLPRALFWNVVESMTVSIFDSGRKKNEQIFSQALQEEMVESYARTLHQAIKEVESALASVRLSERRLKAQQDTIEAARRAWNISANVYALGGIDYMALLDTQRNYHRYLDEHQKTRMDYYRSYVSLFHALGGGVKPGRNETRGTLPATPLTQVEGISINEGSSTSSELFWQVELAGLYHRTAIGPAWRDLLSRYPGLMEGRVVRPRLSGKIDGNADGAQSWHRLYVAKFSSPETAEKFCQTLRADQQRCRVVSSQADDTVQVTLPSRSRDDITPRPATTTSQPAPPNPLPLPQDERPSPLSARERVVYSVQLGAFSSLENAGLSQAFWRQKGYDPFVSESRDSNQKVLYTVRTGVYDVKMDAQAAAKVIRDKEDGPAVTVPMMVNSAGLPDKIDVGTANSTTVKTSPVAEPPEALSTSTAVAPDPGGPDKTSPEPTYTLQLGAFSAPENATVSANFWRARGYRTRQVAIKDPAGRPWFAVRSGLFAKKIDAEAAALAFGQKENSLALVIPDRTNIASVPTGATVKTPASAPASASQVYALQFGVFTKAERAYRIAAILQEKNVSAYVTRITDSSHQTRYAVRVGRYNQRSEGQALLDSLDPKDRARATLVDVQTVLPGATP